MEQIKIIKLVNGDDIVCTIPQHLLDDKSPLVKIDKPLQVKYVPAMDGLNLKDYVALIKWTSYSDDTIISIPKDKIMTITNASLEMASSYHNIAADWNRKPVPVRQQGYQQKKFSDQQNEKVNELFEELEEDLDEPKTIH